MFNAEVVTNGLPYSAGYICSSCHFKILIIKLEGEIHTKTILVGDTTQEN
jgi:hypothetical protein